MASDGGLRRLFQANLPRAHCQPVETGLISMGVPDMNFCAEGVEGWVEFKQTDGYAVTLEPEQVSWLSRRARSGGRVFVAVRRWHTGGPRKGPPVDELWLLRGEYAPDLKSLGLRWAEQNSRSVLIGRWSGGPARWDWRAVRGKLLAPLPRVRNAWTATRAAAKDDI